IIPPVYISKDSVIESSTIGPYVMIEQGVHLINTELKNSVVLEKSLIERSFISDSVIGTNSVVRGLKAHSLKVGDYSVIQNGSIE
ncbi:MAG: nucleotidyltransferase, partial [Candidatus Heimdallarchaeaceae archaeon]